MKNRIKKLAKVSIFQILKPNHSMIHQTFQRSSLPPQRKKKENHLCPLFKRLPPLPILPSKEKSERKARSSIDSRQVAAASSLQWNVCFQRRESFEPGGKTPRRGWTERFPLFLPPLASYSFTYGARLYQGPITIDNRPIGAKPRVYIYIYVYIEPHRFVGSMTNNSHNGPSRFQPLAPLPPRFHSSLQPFQSCLLPPPTTLLPPGRVIHDQIGSGNFTFTSDRRWFIIMFAIALPSPLLSSPLPELSGPRRICSIVPTLPLPFPDSRWSSLVEMITSNWFLTELDDWRKDVW